MPMQVRRKYEQMETPENEAMVAQMLRNFDEALLHPDRQDMINARAFVHSVYQKMQAL